MATEQVAVRFTDMTVEQFQAHLDQRSVNTHDAERVASWFAEDGVQRMMATGETARGRAGIASNMARLFEIFPDVRIEVHELFSSGDRMCARCMMTGTHLGEGLGISPTGRRFEYALCLVFRFEEDGLVAEEVVYSDSATLMSQLGMMG